MVSIPFYYVSRDPADARQDEFSAAASVARAKSNSMIRSMSW